MTAARGGVAQRMLRRADDDGSQVYGSFAIVIGLLAEEINIVRARRLWPRSLIARPFADEDRAVLARQAEVERALPEEWVELRSEERAGDGGDR